MTVPEKQLGYAIGAFIGKWRKRCPLYTGLHEEKPPWHIS